jgi:hypothetical protein
VPLMIFPKRRTAKAKVRVNSEIILNGSINQVGSRYVFRYPRTPPSTMPNTGNDASYARLFSKNAVR